MSTLGAIISWAVFGLVAGAIARLLMPGRQPMSLVMTMALGVVGSMAGGFLSWAFAGAPNGQFQPSSMLMSVVGAIIVLWIAGASATRRSRI